MIRNLRKVGFEINTEEAGVVLKCSEMAHLKIWWLISVCAAALHIQHQFKSAY